VKAVEVVNADTEIRLPGIIGYSPSGLNGQKRPKRTLTAVVGDLTRKKIDSHHGIVHRHDQRSTQPLELPGVRRDH
jgi:hypothetical protein